ncbi:hypothetical protein V8G54_025044 [Vigna mungo]|uniref:Uncharacterized protein n=1 Tax=Vigna mungo TaxID=3915 RepID=A0AAQ3N6R5_VIGMU
MKRAANMDNPAPDNDASVKSLGIFLLTQVKINNIKKSFLISRRKRKRGNLHSQITRKICIASDNIHNHKTNKKIYTKTLPITQEASNLGNGQVFLQTDTERYQSPCFLTVWTSV